jgi:phage terminase small subunit
MSVALKPKLDELTERQALFVEHFITSGSISAASKAAGYASETVGYRAIESAKVQRAIADYRNRVLNTEGATLAYQTLLDCMKPGNPGAVRVSAAKVVWQATGMLERGADRADKSLQDMTPDELADQIRKFDQALSQVADGARPITTVIEGS